MSETNELPNSATESSDIFTGINTSNIIDFEQIKSRSTNSLKNLFSPKSKEKNQNDKLNEIKDRLDIISSLGIEVKNRDSIILYLLENNFDGSQLLYVVEEVRKYIHLEFPFNINRVSSINLKDEITISVEIYHDIEEELKYLYINIEPSDDDEIFNWQLETIEKVKKSIEKKYEPRCNVLISLDF